METYKTMTITKYNNCILCKCCLDVNNRAQWVDHCKACETKVFQFYGAVDEEPRPETEEK